jgi:hypothetical protein
MNLRPNPLPDSPGMSARARRVRRSGVAHPVALGVFSVCVAISVVLTQFLAASAGRNQLTYTDRIENSMTREEALGVAAGAFRGLFVNWLWIRANNLKQDGKYYEAVDLSRTITRLQPRFPRVWVFHAWNLAYNISVAAQTREERWQWVDSGVRLLREQAIPANPNDLLLHRELGWIFLHKIQGTTDDANIYYKQAMAVEWSVILGPPPTRNAQTRSREAYVAALVDWLEVVRSAPSTLQEVYAAQPAARELVERLGSLGIDITTRDGRRRLLASVEQFRAMTRMAEMAGVNATLGEPAAKQLLDLLNEPTLIEARRLLVRHLRKHLLERDYRYDTDRMVRYTQKYGPLDWRHPASHALYWAARGVEQAQERTNEFNVRDQDFINTDRIVIQSLQELYRSGTVLFDISSPTRYIAMVNGDFIPSYGERLKEAANREVQQFLAQHGADITERPYRFYSAGYENFLSDAISYLYRAGDIEGAQAYKTKLALWPHRNTNNIDVENSIKLPLEDYVQRNLAERVTSPNVAMQEVDASLMAGITFGLLAQNPEVFASAVNYARQVHTLYFQDAAGGTAVNPDAGRTEIIPRDFSTLMGQRFAAFVNLLGPVDGALAYRAAPLEVQQLAYEVILSMFKGGADPNTPPEQQANAQRLFDRIYPKPPGFDEWLAARRAARPPDLKRGDVELR